jgi:hypothetical protein
MKAGKPLFAFFALFAGLSIHGCGGDVPTEAAIAETTAETLIETTAAPLPPPTTVSGSLTFTMSKTDAENIVASLADEGKANSIKTAFAEGLASGLDGVDADDIIITKISLPARRLEGRSLSDSSSLLVDYTIKVAAAASAPDLTAIDTTAVAAKTQTELKDKAEIEVKVDELAKPVAPAVDSGCKSALVAIDLWRVENDMEKKTDRERLAMIKKGDMCELFRTVAASCATKADFDKNKLETGPQVFDDIERDLTMTCHACGHGFLTVVWSYDAPADRRARALSSIGHSRPVLGRRLDGHIMTDEQCVAVNNLVQDTACSNDDFKKLKMEDDCPTPPPDNYDWDANDGEYTCPNPKYMNKDEQTLPWKVNCGACGKGWSKLNAENRRALSLSAEQPPELGRRLGGHIMSDEKCADAKDFLDSCKEAGFKEMVTAYDLKGDCKEDPPANDDGHWEHNCEREDMAYAKISKQFSVFCGDCFKAILEIHPQFKDGRRAQALSLSAGQLPDLGRRLDGHIMNDDQCAAVKSFDTKCTDAGFVEMKDVVPDMFQDCDDNGSCTPMTRAEWFGRLELFCGTCMRQWNIFYSEEGPDGAAFTASTEQCAAVTAFESGCTLTEWKKLSECSEAADCETDEKGCCPAAPADIVTGYKAKC